MRLRLYNTPAHAYGAAPFRVVGVAAEFATAPHDAFLVVNQRALVAATGDPHIDFFLVARRRGPCGGGTRDRCDPGRDPAVSTQTIGTVAAGLATSLTALNLHGLATIELAYTVAILTIGVLIALLAGWRSGVESSPPCALSAPAAARWAPLSHAEALLIGVLAIITGAAGRRGTGQHARHHHDGHLRPAAARPDHAVVDARRAVAAGGRRDCAERDHCRRLTAPPTCGGRVAWVIASPYLTVCAGVPVVRKPQHLCRGFHGDAPPGARFYGWPRGTMSAEGWSWSW